MSIAELKELKEKLTALYLLKIQTEVARDIETVNLTKKEYHKELQSKQWKKKREEAFQHWGKRCVVCGSEERIVVHHLAHKEGNHIWEYNVNTLIPLCMTCHYKASMDKNHPLHVKKLSENLEF